MRENYCKIFIDYHGSDKNIVSIIAEKLIIEDRSENWLQTEVNEMFFRMNKEFIKLGLKRDFLNYRIIVDIEKNEKINQLVFIDSISTLLFVLWNNNIPAIASCSFENSLPFNGYNTVNKPWDLVDKNDKI